MLAVAVWSLAYALELVNTDLPTILFWDNIAWLGSAFTVSRNGGKSATTL
jgi:hypothetical protein